MSISRNRLILETEYVLLVLALVCFAISTVIDFAIHPPDLVYEEAFKLLGVILWTVYFLRVGLAHFRDDRRAG